MTSKLTPVPSTAAADPAVNRHMQVVRENMNRMIGAHRDAQPLAPLPPTATLDDLIQAVNALISRMT